MNELIRILMGIISIACGFLLVLAVLVSLAAMQSSLLAAAIVVVLLIAGWLLLNWKSHP